MSETIRELISEERVNEKIRELGAQISKDYAGESVHLVCILKGACIFMCELAKRINVPVSMDFMTVSSYGSGTKSSGIVRIKKDLDDPIKDLNVLIVEAGRVRRGIRDGLRPEIQGPALYRCGRIRQRVRYDSFKR